ncbi:class I SAM-dependent methyltransferase [Flammeovirga agarivorans]|uniref:SAM-dependent methyltransferase n=1 Tax=Flammeovirga agarivorans TaxID=2726742 RepID=A0A7X8XU07_9BACT|nr:SAM-dependent methyltransferase [Flammeovirga agarivorans]NLR89883.1 SAM-dependent methyltransferase [Flammeovirga agarivorans]
MSLINVDKFEQHLKDSLKNNTFVKITLSNKRVKENDLKSINGKLVELKKGLHLSCLYRYPTKDITKNYPVEEVVEKVMKYLEENFYNADLYTVEADYHLLISPKNSAKLRVKAASTKEKPKLQHDKQKNRLIGTKDNVYLQELGVTTKEFKVKNSMQDKYRQLNKYVEIIDGILKNVKFDASYNVVDMGAGKGYLTFGLYDYLTNVIKQKPHVIGVEMRKELVEKCNGIAERSKFDDLEFVEGTIKEAELPGIDLLIALHACDTATDDAIYRGIQAQSKVIVCAPCCHKQIRKQINPEDSLSKITQFGILKERQAELLTDGIRALIMEAYGYKTKVFEFITTEHTPKNVLVVGVQEEKRTTPKPEVVEQINEIKRIHGITSHHLEELLEMNITIS